MKSITNWRAATVADFEADNLLDEATKLHVMSYQLDGKSVFSIPGDKRERLIKFFNYHIDNSVPIVMHNGICYDVPLVERLLGVDLSGLMVIDTLPLSWYLNVDRQRHGLDSFLEDYGIEKPKIDDWENLTYEEYEHRCSTDVGINVALWEDFKARLLDMYYKAKVAIDSGLADCKRPPGEPETYLDTLKGVTSLDEWVSRILTFLCHKMDIVRLKEHTRFDIDINTVQESIETLGRLLQSAKETLESVMPKVPKYSIREKPAKMFLLSGELSKLGLSWNADISKVGTKDALGNTLVAYETATSLKLLKGYEEPKISSPAQIKAFLFLNGWEPENFKYDVSDEDREAWVASGYRRDMKPVPRKIPQINVDGENGKELCPSVLRLAEKCPQIAAYANYSVIKHRHGLLVGFIEDQVNGSLKAGVGGFTNTLREKHREIVNLPGATKPYGEYVRKSFVAKRSFVLCGSDISSLEDSLKHHFMIPWDAEYVATMMEEGYDPHLKVCVIAALMTKEDELEYKALKKLDNKTKEQADRYEYLGNLRKIGKSGNYACQYGSGAETLSRTLKIPLTQAKTIVEGYKRLNWSLQEIADEQRVITCDRGLKWLVNPINGLLYNIRSDKDRFSTLCQGSGSFVFDMWVDRILTKVWDKYKVRRLNLTMHDEFVMAIRDTPVNRDATEKLVRESLDEINQEYRLRKPLGCDVQFGNSYADIH